MAAIRAVGVRGDPCGAMCWTVDPLLLMGIEPVFWRCPDKTQVAMQTTPSGYCMCKLVLGGTTSREWRVKTLTSQCGGVRVMAVRALRGGECLKIKCRNAENA